ncbi:MAG TPA: hypothetical protein VLR46_01510 [Candidatus Dormibacteraeota bacterium]|nr:hypothetical protein [Candidatus Dormibacteraeota bacterium]
MSEHNARSTQSSREGEGPPPVGHPDPSPAQAPKAGTEALTARLRAAAASLPGSTHAIELRRRDRQRAGSVLAAGIAARTFLMLLPLAFILAAGVGFLDQTYPNFSARTVRAAGLTANLVKVVAQSSGDARRGRWVLLIVGVVLLVYAAQSLYRALYMTHLVTWDMTAAESHAGSVVLACALLVLFPILGGLASLARELPPGVLLLVGVPAGVALNSALWLVMSWLLPHRADRWTGLVPGALAWGGGMIVLQFISVFVLPDRLGGMSQLYGSLATASSTIAWLFIFGRLTVGAATLNAALWDRRVKAIRASKASPA